ncbi:MAG: T9SS type A sorting domain-containing protein, partial [Salibacteraceae bacterium]
VSPLPAPIIQVSNDTSICPHDSAILWASSSTGSIWWYLTNSDTITVSNSGTYHAQVIDSNNCRAFGMVNVSHLPLPNVALSADTAICPGDSALMSVSGAATYLWSNGSTSTSSLYPPGIVSVIGTDTFGCASEDTALVTQLPGYLVTGQISDNLSNPVSNSKVFLVKYFAAQDSVIALDSVLTDANGNYVFATTEPEVYIKAVPDVISYPNLLPTYYSQAPVFQQADSLVVLPCDTTWANIQALPGTAPGGAGFISGYVYQGAGKSELCQGDPMAQLSLVVVDANGNWIDQVTTDASGFFQTQMLWPGNYKLWPDKPGVLLQPTPEIQVTAGAVENLQFHMKGNLLELCTPTGWNSLSEVTPDIQLWPNPNAGNFTLQTNALRGVATHLEIIDAHGAVVSRQSVTSDGQGRISLSMPDLAQGLYFIKIASNKGTWQVKFIRQ